MQIVDDSILKTFVAESNALETIPKRPIYFTAHLEAANAVCAQPRRYLEDPAALHRFFFGALENGEAGEYRTYQVRVRGQLLPDPDMLPVLMNGLYYGVQKLLDSDKKASDEQKTDHAWEMHHKLFCIHPFTDGNGRMARLLLNAYRLQVGLSWHTIWRTKSALYFQQVRLYEDTIFRPRHPWAYGVA